MSKDRLHLLPFSGRAVKGADRPAPEPVDPGLLAALEWRRTRAQRVAAAKAARAVPAGVLLGTRYSGGSVGTLRSAR